MNARKSIIRFILVKSRLFRACITLALLISAAFTSLPADTVTAASIGAGQYLVPQSIPGSSPDYSVAMANSVTALLFTLPDSPVVGTPVVFHVSVTAEPPGSGTPTGVVDVLQDGITLLCVATLPAGICSYTFPAAGSYAIVFQYTGDASFNASFASKTLSVQITTSSTSLAPDTASPIIFGQPVSFLASVTPATATGTVSFEDSGIPIVGCEAVAVASGDAICTPTTPGLAVGTHNIAAFYSGDTIYSSGYSNSISYGVNIASTTTAFTGINPVSPVINQPVAFNFSVSPVLPSVGVPDGNVEVKNGSTVLCSAAASAGTCSHTFTAGGTYTLSINYLGSASFTSSSASLTLDITAVASTTVLSSTPPSPAVYGQPVAFTAAVTPPSATGAVDFADGGVPIGACQGVALSGGQVSCNFTNLGLGSHLVTAFYHGNATLSQSLSNAVAFTVNMSNATPTFTGTTPSTLNVGQAAALNFTVTANPPSLAVPTGNVDVMEGTVILCSATVAAGTCNYTFATYGTHNLTLQYGGDTFFNPSSAPASVSVQGIPTVTSLGANPVTSSVFSQPVTFTATIAPLPNAGTITFMDGVTSIAGCANLAVVAGQASCTVSNLAIGSHSLTASFSGDTVYTVSLGSLTYQVNPASTMAAITTNLASMSFINNPLLVSVSVTPVSPATAAPTGNVTISDGVVSCTAALSSGTASCSLTFTSIGVKSITVTYTNVDGNFLGSASTPVSHTVGVQVFLPVIHK